MSAIRIRKTLDSDTLHLPELRPLIGRTVEIVVQEQPEPATRDEFYAVAGHIPDTEGEWAGQQATLKGWRADPRFEPFWPLIDRLLATDFASAHRWATFAEAVRGITDYDFDAQRDQDECDLRDAEDHLRCP